MAIDVDGDRDQVMAFLCGLTCDLGDNPTYEQAKAYSKRSLSIIDPSTAIQILGVSNWNDVLKVYDRYISGKSMGLGRNPFKRCYGNRRYTYDELVEILKGLYEEFGGEMSQQRITERAQRVQTPSYTTFVRILGPMKYWPQIIKEAEEKKNTPNHTNITI